jgi:hypothetical protein
LCSNNTEPAAPRAKAAAATDKPRTVGIASFPNQLHAESLLDTFNFTVMVAGENPSSRLISPLQESPVLASLPSLIHCSSRKYLWIKNGSPFLSAEPAPPLCIDPSRTSPRAAQMFASPSLTLLALQSQLTTMAGESYSSHRRPHLLPLPTLIAQLASARWRHRKGV